MERATRRYNPAEKYIPKPMSREVAELQRQLVQPASPEEIARRGKAVEKLLKGRDSMPLLDIDVTELVRQVREEAAKDV